MNDKKNPPMWKQEESTIFNPKFLLENPQVMLFFILCVSSTQDNLLNCKWELPVDPVVSTLSLQLRDMSSTPGEGTKIPQIMQCGQKKKKNLKIKTKKTKHSS